ncbi:MAG: hypothetical protein K2M60_01690 [Lachnospiraceae bacterium]|nr:hypothetical protein [Lachnospiraceae bacterium]MDE6252437.1 hypothetical protein [Lachnospiraceae bacterium]
MKKSIKRIGAVACMCMLFSTTAFADKKPIDFDYIAKGGSGYTATNPKSDNEGYAYVTVTSSNQIEGDKVEYVVTSEDKNTEVTDGATFYGTSKPDKQKLKYKSGYAKTGKKYRLKITTYNYSLEVHGRWNS